MRISNLALIGLSLAIVLATPSASSAAPPAGNRIAGAVDTATGGEAWASFKEIDVAEQRAMEAMEAMQGAAGGGGEDSGVAVSQSAGSGWPDGCFERPIASSDGMLRLLLVCPGQGGYMGLGGEAFGIRELILRDPASGELLPAAQGGWAEMVVADPRVLAERAVATLQLPAPAIRMSPRDDQVVRLASWLWIPAGQWRPRQVSASAGPVTSTVTATPARVTWDMGNGDQTTCDGPGTPYESRFAGQPEVSDCTYTYVHSSAGQPDDSYDVTATIYWDLTWNATGAVGGGSLGSVPISATRPVRVTEIQALVQ